ncbi:SRPBCC family protein [Bradyrhizobium retamae]|uniref:Cyclase n=1 Tax=Bradyrhizobium retamae TaxID=1300035 RepID=A0A0R3MYG9_9BRAD|nr:SRPBCC family protein [Bradyrhizobium retamae]KRR24606.1 cyclase [Bradyrhizobium retamae]
MGVSFERSHDIMIETPPPAVYDYVCNPNSWPEWLAASHHIDGENRPLLRGETFREKWHIKRGEVNLAWVVTESDPSRAWTVEADTDFIGKIVIRYTFEATAAGTKYTRTLCNPDRPSEPSPAQIARMDEEAAIGLQNIKRNVEKRFLLSETGRA